MTFILCVAGALICVAWVQAAVDLVVGGYPAQGALAIAFLVCLVFLTLLARRAGKGKAYASATAYAQARARAESAANANANANQAVVINVDTAGGARAVAAREFGGLDSLEWRGDSLPLINQDVVQDVDEDLMQEIMSTQEEAS